MSRTIRSSFSLLAIGLLFWPVYGQDPAPTAPPSAQEPATLPTQPPAVETDAPAAKKDRTPEKEEGSREKGKKDNDTPLPPDQIHNPVLWEDPGNIGSRNLLFGQGGEKRQPKPPFTFVSEDSNGTNPKFDVLDADGKKWRVKLGEEARPEVVASRMLWAIGYFANDDYLLHVADVQGLDLKRGGGRVKNAKTGTGQVIDVRFARKPGGERKIGIWDWKDNPFYGKREFNGLRVMMAVMNNWDLKDINNAVYYDKKNDRQIFLASDVGAAFGTNGMSWTRARSKGNINSFKGSKFITRVTDTEVDFGTPKAPAGILVASFGTTVGQYAKRTGLNWIGTHIPREDARWMGSLLGQLTHEQLTDAFRAGNFPADQIEAYVDVVESRIAELKKL